MSFYVYIIRSQRDQTYYKGFSERPVLRLDEHNTGRCRYTSTKLPWKLVYVEELLTKTEALIRERSLKKYAHAQIGKLIVSHKNILSTFDNSTG